MFLDIKVFAEVLVVIPNLKGFLTLKIFAK